MRESRFRVWDKENNCWFQPTYKAYLREIEELLLTQEGELVLRKYNRMEHESLFPNRFEKTWYTGLKDKNGREIYEGDIIYWEIDNGIGIESYSAVVWWSENKEQYKTMYKWIVLYLSDYLRGDFDELATPAAYDYKLQTIGNIYENPELLEALK